MTQTFVPLTGADFHHEDWLECAGVQQERRPRDAAFPHEVVTNMGVCHKNADLADWERKSAPREKPEGTLTAQIFFPSIEMNKVSIV